MEEIKTITKKGFRRIAWTTIIVGLIFNAIFYTILTKTLEASELQYVGLLALFCIVIGFGMGLAYSRMWVIKDFEKRL